MPSRPRQPLRLLLACLLVLATPPSRAADPSPRPIFSPAWLTVTADDSLLLPAGALFQSDDPTALGTLLAIFEREPAVRSRFAQLDDDLAICLLRDLDHIARSRPHLLRDTAADLVDLLGPRRPEAVDFLLRASARGADAQLAQRAAMLSRRAFTRPADDPALLYALVDAATDPDPRLAEFAVSYLTPPNDPAVATALATVVARNAVLGQYRFLRGRDNFALRLPPTLLADAFATALRSSLDDVQRVCVLAAVHDTQTFDRIPDDHPLVREIAILTATPCPTAPVPTFRQLIRAHLDLAFRNVGYGVGNSPPPDILNHFKSDPRAVARTVRSALAYPDPTARLAVLRSLTTLDPHALLAISAVIEPTRQDDPDPAVRELAATLLGDDRAQALARVPDWIADCRADSPTLRATAARHLHESGLFPAPLTAALLRAVANRDMPAREGLLRALEQSHAAQSDPLANLQQAAAAADDSATRAYAKAALRDLDPQR